MNSEKVLREVSRILTKWEDGVETAEQVCQDLAHLFDVEDVPQERDEDQRTRGRSL